jgi:AAHS family 3-hydroxyphenylpropionic acid transporter
MNSAERRVIEPPIAVGISLCALCALCEGIDLQAAGVAAAGIGAEFHPSPTLMGTFFSASTFGLFLGAVIGGRISDAVGRKWVLTSAVALFGLCSVLNAFAWDLPTLIGFRLLTGLGLGGALPMIIAYVSETAQAPWQRASVAMVYAATPLGGALVSLVSLLINASQWRTIFIVSGVVPLMVAPLMAWRLPESRAFRQAATSRDMPRAGSFTAIFSQGRALRTGLLWTSFFLELLVLYLLLNWLPTLLVAHGMSRGNAAAAQIGFNAGGAVTALGMGAALEGRFRMPVVTLTFALIPVLLWVMARVSMSAQLLVFTVLVLGCAVLAAQAFLYASAPGAYPVTIRGVGAGAAVAAGRVGSIVGPQLGGMLKAAGHDTPQLLLDLVPIAIAGSLAALSLAYLTRQER